jgi:WD40 repeat protein
MARFSPDGRRVLTVSDDHSARVWDAQTGQPVTDPLLHLDHVKWAEFSPDGTSVVTASTDSTACIWDARSGRRLTPALQQERIVEMAEFSPDGLRIATVSLDRTARIWEAATGRALTPPLRHDAPVYQLAHSPDGWRVLTGCSSGARLWDAETGRPMTEWMRPGSRLSSARFDATGQRVAVAAQSLRVWDLPSAPTPLPAWFIAFAEAVAGIRLDDHGNAHLVPRTELDEAAEYMPPDGRGDYYGSLARWFLSDPEGRAPTPF